MIPFTIGLIIGACLGLFVAALCRAARSDEWDGLTARDRAAREQDAANPL